MSVRVGIVMDPIADISYKKDSSLAMLLAAQAHGRHIKSTEQSQTSQNAINIACRLLTWTDARNKGTGLLKVFRYVFRIEHQRRIEEAEENNPCTKQQNIQRLTRSDRLRDVLQPAVEYSAV